MPAQHRLDEFLVAAVRQLGGAPGAGKRPHQLARVARRGQGEASELVPREAREVGDVGRKVGRQAQRAHLVGEPQAPEMLHGARLGGVRLDVARGPGLRVDQQRPHAAPAELVCEHQAERAAAGDEDRGCRVGSTRNSSSKARARPSDGTPIPARYRGALGDRSFRRIVRSILSAGCDARKRCGLRRLRLRRRRTAMRAAGHRRARRR